MATTPIYKAPIPTAGAATSVAQEEERELAWEHPLQALHRLICANDLDGTLYDGFLVSAGAGLSISVAAGYGFVDGLAIYAAGATAKTSLTDDSTLYIYLKLTATTPADRTFTVEQSLSGPPLADAILIATVTTSGGAVTAVDNSPASRSARVRVPGHPRKRVVAPFGAEYTSPKTAIEACNAGDVVHICPGTYTLTATITIPANNITVEGPNADAVILSNTTGSSQNLLDLNGKDGLKLRHFTLQAAAGNTGYGITGSGCDDLVLEQVKVISVALTRGFSLSSGACNRARVLNCRLTGAIDGYGIILVGPSSKVLGNRIEITSLCTALDVRSDDILVADNEISMSYSGYSSVCVYLRSGNRVRCRNNLIRATAAPGAWTGIRLYNPTDTTTQSYNHISDNVIVSIGDAGTGIKVDTTATDYIDESIIAGNICADFATGIHLVDARVRETLVHGNKLATCTTPITDAGTNTNAIDQD